MTINTEAITSDFGWIIADAAVVLFSLLFAMLGTRKGLYETFRPVIVVVLAVSCAIFLTAIVTPIATEAVWPKVEAAVSDEIQNAIDNMDGSEAIFSENVNSVLITLKLDDKVDEIIREKATNAVGSVQGDVMDAIKAGLSKVIHSIAFVIILLAAMLVFTLVSHAIKIAEGAPVIKQINWLGGFAVGFLEALVILYIAVKFCAWKEIPFFEDHAAGTYLLSKIINL